MTFLSLKTDVNVPTESNKQNKLQRNTYFLLKSLTKRAGPGYGSVNQVYGSWNLDPYGIKI
jgi:hypothetical protein